MAILPVWLIFLVCYLSFIVIFMVIPASLGFSFGIRSLYLATLYKVFEFGRKTIQSKQGMKSNVIDKTPAKPTKGNLPRNRSFGTFQREFHMGDAVEFCVNGVEAIIDDEVTKCFSAEELVSWNFLTRTNENYHYISVKLTIMWIVGCFIRYVILFPMRLTVFLIGMTILITSRIFIAQLPKSRLVNINLYFAVANNCFSCLDDCYPSLHASCAYPCPCPFLFLLNVCHARISPSPSGAPNDGFLLNTLKTLFRLSRVLLDLCSCILSCAIRFVSCSFILFKFCFIFLLCSFRNWLDTKLMLISFRIFARAVSAVITFHNKENMAKGGGICVANHTTPLDVLILMCDRCYSLVGQRQPGLFGFFEKTLAKTQDHIWFERTEMKDRLIVTKRLREHVEDASKNPILIFPEGTCINNTSVMMFKKGSFEISGDIYPVAIKASYDPTFGNAFWNSSTEGFALYLFLLLTNWALVCDVWYLPRMTRLEDETAVQFANRVKTEIARQGGLVDLIWDGQLKRTSVKPEFRQRRQEDYASTLKVD
ncbi:unnamed protein product [Porites evermanni]|uniref:Phospholipid/glycerol acyltransferase domain-containing protein n=1 Tax=Porites evermanni TaxID=104178 RepID=A0ABN8LHE3_9CNID|nr:unnamed protein product [Porites evermanni]